MKFCEVKSIFDCEGVQILKKKEFEKELSLCIIRLVVVTTYTRRAIKQVELNLFLYTFYFYSPISLLDSSRVPFLKKINFGLQKELTAVSGGCTFDPYHRTQSARQLNASM